MLPLAVTAHVLYRKTVGNYLIFHSGNDAQLHDMLENLYIEYLGHAKYSCTFLNSMLVIFWAMLLRFHENDIESIFTKDSTGNSVTEILNYLNRHYQSVTLREAAKHFGYSTSHFSTLIKESPEHFMRTFKKTYRMTPGETGRRTGNKRLQDLIYFLYNRYRSGRYLSYPPL